MPTNEEIREAYIRAGCNLSVARGFLPSSVTEDGIIAAISENEEVARSVATIERSMTRVRINDALNRALMVLGGVIAEMDERSLLRLLPALLAAHAAGIPAPQVNGAGGGQQNTFNMLMQVLPPDARTALMTLVPQEIGADQLAAASPIIPVQPFPQGASPPQGGALAEPGSHSEQRELAEQ